MTNSRKTARRSLLAGLSATCLGLVLALAPAASASAASATLYVTNNCGYNIYVSIYVNGGWVLGGPLAAGASQLYRSTTQLNRTYTIVLPKGTFYPYLGDGYGYMYRAC